MVWAPGVILRAVPTLGLSWVLALSPALALPDPASSQERAPIAVPGTPAAPVAPARPLSADPPSLPIARTAQAQAAQAERPPLDLRVHLHEVDGERRAPLERTTRDAVTNVQHYLNMRFSGQLDIEFVGSEDAFARVMADHGAQGWDERWLAGLALLDQRRIIVHVNGTRALTTRETLEHELVHAALHATGAGLWLPRWYQEGVATLLAGEATWERLRDIAGAGPLGQLESLHALNQGFGGSQVAVQRAYAASAGFLRFCTARAGSQQSVGQMQQRLTQGMGFDSAFALTFGGRPADLYGAWAAQMQASASSWAMLLSDSAIWSLVSLLAMFSMMQAWRHRPRFDEESEDPAGWEPLDLEAVAAEALAARHRPWLAHDFALATLELTGPDTPQDQAEDDQPGDGPAPAWASASGSEQASQTAGTIADSSDLDDPGATAQDGWITPERRLRPWHLRNFAAQPLQVPEPAEGGRAASQGTAETFDSDSDSQITDHTVH